VRCFVPQHDKQWNEVQLCTLIQKIFPIKKLTAKLLFRGWGQTLPPSEIEITSKPY
jgi:hypothetical protein